MIPRKLRVLGKTYTVICRKMDDDALGMHKQKSQEIFVRDDLGPDLERDTFLHETIHAIDETLNLGLTEAQVNSLGAAVYAVLSDNPKAVDYIMGVKE